MYVSLDMKFSLVVDKNSHIPLLLRHLLLYNLIKFVKLFFFSRGLLICIIKVWPCNGAYIKIKKILIDILINILHVNALCGGT